MLFEWEEDRTSTWPAPELLLPVFLMLSNHPFPGSEYIPAEWRLLGKQREMERKSSSHSNTILKLCDLGQVLLFPHLYMRSWEE